MESSTNEIIKEIPGLIRIFKDGRFQKLYIPAVVPAGTDLSTGVTSKDVVISPENNITARLFIPKSTSSDQKLPLLIYFHGGGFIIGSSSTAVYHNFLNLVVSESNVVAVSVDYRLVPEFPLSVAYEDSWEAIKWVADHANGNGPDPWLNEYADLQNVFLGGESAGGNIAHHMAIRLGSDTLPGFRLHGAILLHPYFWGKERVGNESDWITPEEVANADALWDVVHPGSSGPDDPLINPDMDPRVGSICCSKILVCIGGNDLIRERNWYYKKVLEKSGWKGKLEMAEDKGEGHGFFLLNPSCQNASILRTRISTFINEA